MVADNKNVKSNILATNIHRALVFQGAGSLGAYEAGAYKGINEELSRYLKSQRKENEPIFHIVAGTSIGAINAAILVIHVNYFKDFCF
jgi:predicted acylesterase/phospholipase RssA